MKSEERLVLFDDLSYRLRSHGYERRSPTLIDGPQGRVQLGGEIDGRVVRGHVETEARTLDGRKL